MSEISELNESKSGLPISTSKLSGNKIIQQAETDKFQLQNENDLEGSRPGETGNFLNNFKDLPPPYDVVKQKLIADIQSGKFDDFYGLDESSDVLRIFHATVASKLKGIADKGLMAFKEREHQEPRVYVTASPTLALYHGIKNGPHDTLRKEGKLDASVASGEPVLLVLQVDKAWLASNSDAQQPLSMPQWLKDAKGVTPENDSRLKGFKAGLRNEINELKQGRETSDFGISFPTDQVPPQFIFVQPLHGHQVPISEYVQKVNVL